MKPIRLLLLALLVLAGCDSGDSTPTPPPPAATQPRLKIEITSISPLVAKRRTHLAVDSRSNLYWVQESDSGDDLLFGASQGGIPNPIPQLSIRNFLTLLHQNGGTGNIQSIVIGPDDNLYLYFAGGRGRTSFAGLFQYSKDKQLRLLADTDQLMTETGLGKSLDLARGTLLSSPGQLLFWARHTDAWVLMRLVVPNSLARPVEFRSLFDTVHTSSLGPRAKGQIAASDPVAIKLTSDKEDLSAGPGEKMYYRDQAHGILWQIDAKGTAVVSHSLQGIPEALTTPVFDRAGLMYLLAGEGEHINVLEAGDQDPVLVGIAYPALLTFDGPRPGNKLSIIPRTDMSATVNVQIEPIEPDSLLIDKATGDFVVYDAASGQLLRLKQVKK